MTVIEQSGKRSATPTSSSGDLLTVAQAADYLNITDHFVRRLIRERRIPFLFYAQSFLIPVTLHQVIQSEHVANSRVIDRFSFIVALGHDMQYSLQRRACIVD